LLENAENFSSYVEELSSRIWSLTNEQTNFFTYLVRLKAEVISNASLILDTEKTLVKKEEAMSKLRDLGNSRSCECPCSQPCCIFS
jgi:hypothetical protein